jgi:hypothetical protein
MSVRSFVAGLSAFVAMVIFGVVVAAICGRMEPQIVIEHERSTFENYKDAAARAEEEGYTPYWLGRTFEAGGLTFYGPFAPPRDAFTRGGSVSATYVANTAAGDAVVRLELESVSPAEWERTGARGGAPGTFHTSVVVRGVRRYMQEMPGAPGVPETRRIILEFVDTVVDVQASAGGAPVEGGADANPLLDEATLVSVLEDLRPYPD